MIARFAWYGLLAAIAMVAVFAQLDRQSRRDPALAVYVPAPFQSFALPHRLAAAIDSGDTEHALARARMLVERRPMPSEHLTGLAIAQLRAGDGEGSLNTAQTAAMRGWRNLPAQETMLRIAVAEGDAVKAAKRLAAIWALHPRSDRIEELTQAVLAGPDGRAAFAQELANGPKWSRTFRAQGKAMLAGPEYDALIAESRARGANF